MKFSILIPTYKDVFLEECISSCLSQTYSNYEIIIVNDNSPYNIEGIIKNYTDGRIRYYKKQTGFGAEHIVNNWNRCLEYATGDYVMCIGDDDMLKPNCLEDYARLINQYPDLDVYHTRMEIIDEKSNVTTIQEDRPERETAFSMIWHFWHGRRQVIGDWCFKTKTLKEKGGFIYMPYGWSSDNITAFKFAADKGTANLKVPGFQYRESSINITSRHTIQSTTGKILAWKQVKEWYQSFLKEEDPRDEIDIIYKNDIFKMLNIYIERKIEGEIEQGIHDFPFSITEWLKVGKMVGLSKSYILKKIIKNLLKTLGQGL